MPVRLAHEEQRQQQACQGKPDAEQKWLGPQCIRGGEVASRDSCQGDRDVSCRFIDAHGQPTPRRSHQVNLHNDGGGPTQALVDAQQHIGEDHPSPGRSKDDEERHGQPNQPADHQHPLAPDAITESAREEVGSRFHDAEAHDEGKDRRRGNQAEDTLPEQWHDAALKAHHAANKGIDDDQQRELLPVGTQTKLHN